MATAEFSLTPVSGKSFIGRETVLKELMNELSNIKSHIGFCLYGKRRMGKTSILLETKSGLDKQKDIVISYISFYDMPELSQGTVAETLVSGIIEAYQQKGLLPLEISIKELFKAPLGVILNLLKNAKIEAKIAEQIKLTFEYKDERKDLHEYIRHAFGIGETLAEATNTKCVIILDEFPEIIKVENGLQLVKMLRAQYEQQRRTALVISGSIRKTLDAVALSDSSPFYKQLVPKHIVSFTKVEVAEFLRAYIGRISKEELGRLYELTGGSPFYLQFIGRATKYEGTVNEVVDKFISQEGDLFFKEDFDKLSSKERSIVIALCEGKRSLTDIAHELDEPATTVGSYLPSLIETDVLQKESRGTYYLADNLLAYWLKKRFKGQRTVPQNNQTATFLAS